MLLSMQKQSPRGVLQTCSEFAGEHPYICVVFMNLISRLGCSPVNLLHSSIIPFCHLSENFWGTVFSLFSQLTFNFICFVIDVKDNWYAYILARLIDENKYMILFADFMPHFLF